MHVLRFSGVRRTARVTALSASTERIRFAAATDPVPSRHHHSRVRDYAKHRVTLKIAGDRTVRSPDQASSWAATDRLIILPAAVPLIRSLIGSRSEATFPPRAAARSATVVFGNRILASAVRRALDIELGIDVAGRLTSPIHREAAG